MAHVFISYVREDKTAVDRLCNSLRAAGIDVWLDRDMIQPGHRWQGAIQAAVEGGSFFLACFSGNYGDRNRTYMNEELLLAVEELRKRPRDRSWFIPVLLGDCSVPNLPIGAGETLRDIQWVDMYSNWDVGTRKLIRTLGRTDPEEDAFRWTTLMFTDLVGGTLLSEALTPDRLDQVLKEVTSIQQTAVRDNDGVDLGALSESVMASFSSADAALRCASQIQHLVTRYSEAHDLGVLKLRIGVHAGKLFVSEGRIQGIATHIVARICSRAEAGSILISGTVEERIDKCRFRVESRSTAMLKGINTPIQLFTVRSPQPQDSG